MIGWRDGAGALHEGGLFGAFAALARGEAWSFPALRPHQREPWHAFTVQCAAMALIRASRDDLPEDEATWRELLVALSDGVPEAWELVVDDWSKPALLQPPVSDRHRNEYLFKGAKKDPKEPIATPDALDMLVTAKAHDLKPKRMAAASEEDWLFALVTLQTMEGIMGAGNYGVSRMFGGYGHRMTLGIRPAGGVGAAFRRDVGQLIRHARTRDDRRSGLALLWMAAWDGTQSLAITTLDELYVEICRRVRLSRTSLGVKANLAGSECARIAGEAAGGNTGDPWIPLVIDEKVGRATYGKWVAATPTGAGLGYRKMADLLHRDTTTAPLLAHISDADDGNNLSLVASSLVRGQGKTEGLHRRVVRTSRVEEIEVSGDVKVLDRIGDVAQRRAKDASDAGSQLRRALISLVQGGPEKARLDDDASIAKIMVWMRGFDRRVDADFFDQPFWDEAAESVAGAKLEWRRQLRVIARAVFEEATHETPRTEERRIWAIARARTSLEAQMANWLKEAE